MKPLLLEIEGINSFRQKQVVDFRALSNGNLFCISGKTGSGKTTVLDCVILGLYPKLPSFSTRGNIEDYINLSCDKGEIKLTFELDGTVYRTERVISRKGANTAKLIDVRSGAVVKEKNTEAFAFISEKLGLSVDDFARVIILQQGEFAQFLRASKGDRNAAVIKLFRLDRFSDVPKRFKDAAVALKNELEKKDAALAGYENDTAEYLASASGELKECEKALKQAESDYKNASALRDKAAENQRLKEQYDAAVKRKALLEEKQKELAAEKERLVALETKIEAEKSEVEACRAEKEELVRQATRLDGEKQQLIDLIKRKSRLDEKRAEYVALKEKCEAKQAECAVAEKRIADILQATGESANEGIEIISARFKQAEFDLESRRRLENELKALEEKCGKALSDFSEAERLSEQAAGKTAEAERELEKSRKKLDEVRLAESANDIKKHLCEGDACPVCGEIVKSAPKVVCSDLDGAEEKVSKQEKLAAEARKEQNERTAALASAKQLYEQLFADLRQKKERLAELPASSEQQVSALKKALDGAISLQNAKNERQKLQTELTGLSAELDVVVKQGREDKLDYQNRMSKISCPDLNLMNEKIALVEKNVSAVEKRVAEFDACVKNALELKMSLASRTAENEAALSEVQKLMVKAPDDSAPLLSEAQKSLEEADARKSALIAKKAELGALIASVGQRLELKRALKAERAEINKKYEKMNDLAALFARGEFNAFVATEYIKDFTVSASGTLRELTGGKYALTYDEEESEFYVTDFLNDNRRRKARTLSGGETFLASLSMAIALSKEIARFGTFDFFFIDEGFGTLHDAALDQALDVLFELSKTALVGIVTHRSELIGRIPVTLTVTEADGETGSVCRIVE